MATKSKIQMQETASIEDTSSQDKDLMERVAEATRPKYNKGELLAIFDEILFSNEYREEVLIKGKLKVVFKTKTAAELAKISEELDSKSYQLMATMQQARAFLDICYSLISYNGKDLSSAPIAARKEFLNGMPTAIMSAISTALVEFDLKVEAALSESEAF